MTMTGAVLEALWGNVMAKLLPYGAVPNKAILLTDNPIATPLSCIMEMSITARRLLVRDPSIAPCTFLLRAYYHPHDAMQRQPSDIERTEKLIVAAPSFLPRPSEFDAVRWLALPQEERAFYGLCACPAPRRRDSLPYPPFGDDDLTLQLRYGRQAAGLSWCSPAFFRRTSRSRPQLHSAQQTQRRRPFVAERHARSRFLFSQASIWPGISRGSAQGIGAAFSMAYKRACLLDNLGMAGFAPAFLQRLPLTAEWFALGERL
ncbi:hypothetical protein M8494_11980 [Serratia ureilytica]